LVLAKNLSCISDVETAFNRKSKEKLRRRKLESRGKKE